MNILSSTLWPSDMPDDRRIIALLGLVQISEEGMDKIDVLLKCLPDAPFKERLTEEIGKKDAEIARLTEELNEEARLNGMGGEREADLLGKVERLNALVAMQAEALENIRWHRKLGGSPTKYQYEIEVMAGKALSATSETVSAWQSKRDNEIRAKARKDIICDIETMRVAHDPRLSVPGDEYYAKVIGLLRAKGE